ncbi:MAG: VWA domain-containing protein, partial [Acidobacteriota bacterium]
GDLVLVEEVLDPIELLETGHLDLRHRLHEALGPHRFSVRLTSPISGQTAERFVQAVTQVEVPRLEKLDRVEYFLNEDKIATLYQEPFIQRIEVPQDQPLSYVRAVGYLESGGAAEDIVFVNAPDLVDRLDVNMVELYTSVTDRRGRPVDSISAEDLQILENGEPQKIMRFEPANDLPIHACLLLDTSTSMEDRLREAEDAALYFLELVMTERDRACLMVFNDEPNLVVPFTNSTAVLAGGLSGLVAEGETALNDSLIQTLFRFGGVRGKRALILLSDGADSASDYEFDEVLEYARRSGVTIYSIGLSIDSRALDVRSKLNRLCRETGGSCFFIDGAPELKRTYERIEREVRTQYVISYQSSAEDNQDFREIELKTRSGLKAKTIRGYYP